MTSGGKTALPKSVDVSLAPRQWGEGQGEIRADGRKIHPAYLFEVKKPEESKYPGDFYKTLATIPADQAFRPLAEGGCSLVK